jgi:HSP20 family protein
MVEKSHTAAGHEANWLQNIYDPLRQAGQKIADFFAPQSEAAATDAQYEINVELPGVEPDDIDVSVHGDTLALKGEKRFEREESGKTYFFSERAYGAFQRSFRLPADADGDNVSAEFKNGVLTIKVGKLGNEAGGAKRIPVRQA